MSSIRETNENLVDMLSNTLSQEMFDNRQMLLKILENVRFFGRQGLPLTGNENKGNFDQLTEWLKEKKKRKIRAFRHTKRVLKIMALSILRNISRSIQNGVFYDHSR